MYFVSFLSYWSSKIDKMYVCGCKLLYMNVKLSFKIWIVLCSISLIAFYYISYCLGIARILLYLFYTFLIVENEIFLFLIFELKNHLLNSWTSVQFTRGAFYGAFKFKFGRRNDSFFSERIIDFGNYFIWNFYRVNYDYLFLYRFVGGFSFIYICFMISLL